MPLINKAIKTDIDTSRVSKALKPKSRKIQIVTAAKQNKTKAYLKIQSHIDNNARA